MMNCFCAMVNRRKVFCPVSSWDHCQRSSPLQISDTLRAGFVLLQDLSLGFVEWSCAAVITTAPWGLQVMRKFSYKLVRLQGWLFVAKGISTELCTWIATMESKCWVNMQLSIMFRCDRNTLTSRWKQFENNAVQNIDSVIDPKFIDSYHHLGKNNNVTFNILQCKDSPSQERLEVSNRRVSIYLEA